MRQSRFPASIWWRPRSAISPTSRCVRWKRSPVSKSPSASPATGDDLLVNVEREHIQRALMRANGNKKAAARMLGLSRRALYRRLERLDLGDTIMRRRDSTMDVVSA